MRAKTPPNLPLASRLRERLASEAGMSLVLALAFMTIFTITTAAIVNELVLNQTGAARQQKMVTALAAAEAEMNFATQWVQKNDINGVVASGTTYPLSTDTPVSKLDGSTWYFTGNGVSGATATGWWAKKYPSGGTTCHDLLSDLSTTATCWRVDGRATIGTSTREVRMLLTTQDVQTTISSSTSTTPTTNIISTTGATVTTVTITQTSTNYDYGSWGFGTFSSGAATGSCYSISGNGGISEPVYTPGNLCLAGNAYIHQNSSGNVTLYVGKILTTSSNSFAGTATSKLTSATLGGCNNGGAIPCVPASTSHVYANTVVGNPSTTILKPTVSLASVYASADPGPNHPCSVAAGSTASSTWPTFDGNSTRDNSVGSTTSPFSPSTSYTCKTATGGNISWNASTHVFTITGTVFIDGNLNFSSQTVIYHGRGNIYYNGTVAMSGNGTSYICPIVNCPTDGSWNMATDLMLIGAGNQGSIPTTCTTASWTMTGNAIFQGAGWANGCIQEAGNGGIEGPAVADGYTISGNGSYYQPLGSNTLPPGSPVNSSTTQTTTLATSTAMFTTTGQSVSTILATTTTPIDYWGQLARSWQQLK